MCSPTWTLNTQATLWFWATNTRFSWTDLSLTFHQCNTWWSRVFASYRILDLTANTTSLRPEVTCCSLVPPAAKSASSQSTTISTVPLCQSVLTVSIVLLSEPIICTLEVEMENWKRSIWPLDSGLSPTRLSLTAKSCQSTSATTRRNLLSAQSPVKCTVSSLTIFPSCCTLMLIVLASTIFLSAMTATSSLLLTKAVLLRSGIFPSTSQSLLWCPQRSPVVSVASSQRTTRLWWQDGEMDSSVVSISISARSFGKLITLTAAQLLQFTLMLTISSQEDKMAPSEFGRVRIASF